MTGPLECFTKAAKLRQAANETASDAYRRMFERLAEEWEYAAALSVLSGTPTWYGFHIPPVHAVYARR